jgi:hypothetical protein
MSETKEKETKTKDKSHIINILKHVNNDYAKLLIFLIENNYITDLYDDNTTEAIFSNPNLNIKILLQLSENWINNEKLSASSPLASRETKSSEVYKLSKYLSRNKGITMKDIKSNPQIKWNYKLLSINPNITWEFIKETIESKTYNKLPKNNRWNINSLCSHNRSITLDIIRKNKYKWNFSRLSKNSIITPKIVEDNPDIPWDKNELAKNPNFSWAYLLEHYFEDESELVIHYSNNPNINIKDILSNLEYWVDWIDDKNNIEGKIWINLSSNPGISIQNIVDHPELPWEFGIMGLNPNLTFKTIADNFYPSSDFVSRLTRGREADNFKLGFDIKHLLTNELNSDHFAKNRKDVIFPKFYWITNTLYNVFSRDKDQKEMYHITNKFFDNVNNNVISILQYGIIKGIKDYNDELGKPEHSIFGIIKYCLMELLHSFANKSFNIKNIDVSVIILNQRNILYQLVTWYKKYGGLSIKPKSLNKEECSNVLESIYFTEDIKDIDVNNLISFELNGKVYCYKRENLIAYWYQETDNHGESEAFQFGDCEFIDREDEYGNPIINEFTGQVKVDALLDTCKKYYKIPFLIEGISVIIRIPEENKDKIVTREDVNYWKLNKLKMIKMGREEHYQGEDNEIRQIYIAVPILEKKME